MSWKSFQSHSNLQFIECNNWMLRTASSWWGKKEAWTRPRRPPWWRKRSVPKRRFFFFLQQRQSVLRFYSCVCVKPRFTGRVPPKGLVLYKLPCPHAGSKCILGWKILCGPHPVACACCLSHKYLLRANISRFCKQMLLLCGWLKN